MPRRSNGLEEWRTLLAVEERQEVDDLETIEAAATVAAQLAKRRRDVLMRRAQSRLQTRRNHAAG